MKKIIFFLGLFLFLSCGSDNDTPQVAPPVAVDDTANIQENASVTIDVLDNDTLSNNASLSSFDNVTSNGGSIIERLDKLIYTPEDGFVGTDTFNYTICDGLSTPNCSTASVTIIVNDIGTAVAVDDVIEVTENTTTIIDDLLDNDTIVDGAVLNSIDDSSTVGSVILNTDGTVSYTSNNGFNGEDTFTYTLCDNDDTPTCVTATVTITVIDEGNPNAIDDTVYAAKDVLTVFDSFLGNDALSDDAVLESIDNTLSQGTVVLNNDGTISYTPLTGFIGDDSFTYTICDDDTPNPTCATATVTVSVFDAISFNIPAELSSYYSTLSVTTDGDLNYTFISNHTIEKHTTILSYGERHNYLYNADEDESNTANVILMYTGESRDEREYTSNNNSHSPQTFNTEHVYPQSRLSADDAVTDLHHLRSCDATVNSSRSNFPFVDGSGSNQLIGSTWYPGDDWRGDVARMIMYLNVRYGETFNKVGTLELFLEWNAADPVSPFELQRNAIIQGAQGNRNPFIDNPYLATLIWGGTAAENRWE